MKEYCFNFIPSIYDFFFFGGGGGGSLFEAGCLSTFLAIRWALIEVGAYSNKYSIYQVHLRSLGRGLSLGRVLSSMESRYLKTRRKKFFCSILKRLVLVLDFRFTRTVGIFMNDVSETN